MKTPTEFIIVAKNLIELLAILYQSPSSQYGIRQKSELL